VGVRVPRGILEVLGAARQPRGRVRGRDVRHGAG